MDLAELNALLQVRSEGEHVEFKEAKNNFHFEKLVDYCVALANEKGGRMVLGVTDIPPRRVVGTKVFEIPERTVAGIHQKIQMKVSWDEVQHPDGRVLIFTVPSRPKGHPMHHEGRYWMRAGSDLAPMSPDQLRRIVEEGRPEFVNRLAKTGLSDAEVVSLLDVQTYYDMIQRPQPADRKEVIEHLVARRFVRHEGENLAITNLGALLIAKRLADFDDLERKAVRVIVYDGVSKMKVKDGKDNTGNKGYAVGFEGLVGYVFEQLPASEEIASALRTTTHAYPKKAIREIIGNAIAHQDFNEEGAGIDIEIYDDRIEVTNPGVPILPVDRFISENKSRNERLAGALRQLRICEERGHGIDSVVFEIEVFQLPPYRCRVGSSHTTMILSRYKPLKSLTPEERIQAVYQHCCLRFVTDQVTNNESIRARFKIESKNSAIASRLLCEAVKASAIKPVDEKAAYKLMRYVPYWA